MNLTEKIIAAHLVEGEMKAGSEIALKIDQTLTQDALGMMTYLAFETMAYRGCRRKSPSAISTIICSTPIFAIPMITPI